MSSTQKQHPDASPLNGVVPPEATRWPAGKSPNAGGIPKSVYVARRIASKASPELLELAVRIAKDEGEATKDRLVAISLVVERGLGKAAAMRELYPKAAAKEENALQSDIAGLTDDQRSRIFQILREGSV